MIMAGLADGEMSILSADEGRPQRHLLFGPRGLSGIYCPFEPAQLFRRFASAGAG
jgi:hypothetical protein